MAQYLSDRELRRIERQRRKEEEEEKRMLEELDRELKERQEQELRELKLQQDRIRSEKRAKLNRRREIIEKQNQLEEMKERKRMMEGRQKLMSEYLNIDENAEGTKEQGMVYDNDQRDGETIDERSDESLDGSLYTTLDDLDQENTETCINIGTPIYESSNVEGEQDELLRIEREMKWLENKEKEYKRENIELEHNTNRTTLQYKQTSEQLDRSRRHLESSKHMEDEPILKAKHSLHEGALKGEDVIYEEEISVDREFSYNENDEELELRQKIEQLRIQKRNVEEKIERNKLLKDMQRKEKEKKRLEDLQLKKEMQGKKAEKLRKLKDEKERLERALNVQEKTLSKLEEDVESEKYRNTESEHKEKKEDEHVAKGNNHWTGKLLKPTVPSLTETTFEEWKIEVEVIMKSGLYEESLLRQAVRNSLCGQTRKILLTIPPSTTTRNIIDKLESVYGNVRSGESVLTEFYMARQKRDEGIAEWGIRLESIIQTAIEKGHIQESQKDEMLKTRFWRQLYNEDLKNATRMYFETARTFEELRRKVRIEENEMKSALEEPIREEKLHTLKRQTETHEQMTVLQDLVERMKQLETEISKTRETEYVDRRRYRNDNRADTEYHRKDKEYSSREKRYYGNDKRVDDIYVKDYGRDGRADDKHNGDNGRHRRYDDRYNRYDRYERAYRRDGRSNEKYYRDYGKGSRNDDRYKEYRDRRRYSPRDRRNDRRDYLDKEKEQRYYRNYRDSRDRREYEERNYKDNEHERRYTPNNDDKDSARTGNDREYREPNRDNEQTRKKNENEDKTSTLNSKASLSGGR
ncbi:trichohyalin-like [Mercenaria mercenaria]|uniref:trichohyalin-like n=1 Tax=Mercenaria mercenaria TaxID=6596 RepID=UPI00234EA946|nr:trichohyalin-like [Mercenaria mercenaria]